MVTASGVRDRCPAEKKAYPEHESCEGLEHLSSGEDCMQKGRMVWVGLEQRR